MEYSLNIPDISVLRKIENYRDVIDGMINSAMRGENSTTKKECENPFNFHLADLNNFVTKDKKAHTKFVNTTSFKKDDYLFVESFIFNNSNLVESNIPNQFEEDKLLNITDYYYEKIKAALGKEEYRSEQYKYYINSSYNIIDSFYQYELMHPNSHSNPWTDIFMLCSHGYFLMCENRSDIKEIIGEDKLKKLAGKDTESSIDNNMGVVAKGALKSNKLTGFIMDTRFSLQNILFDILNDNAKDHNTAITSRFVTKILEKNKGGKKYSKPLISAMLNSMKRTGLIGSTTQGYFMLNSDIDINKSISYHQSIVNGLNSTIKVLKSKLKNKL
jgi:hypothetical protein